jgi:hypothetical protein
LLALASFLRFFSFMTCSTGCVVPIGRSNAAEGSTRFCAF